ncbi:MAG: hypothetical protein AAB634_03610 [Patescibacteria group bacterium]
MLKGILKLLFIIGLVVGATYLIPDNVKKNTASKLQGALSNIVPESVKEKVRPVVFTPAERRQKLLEQLDKNIESIKAGLAKTSAAKTAREGAGKNASSTEKTEEEQAPEDLIQKLDETKKIIEEIEEINNEGGVVNKVTTKIYKSVTGGNTETEESCSCEAK